MQNNSANNKRIAKNTLLLYFRMLFLMCISLYTSRVVFNTLGVTDYGIYNVVGGVVAMFGFINGSMASSYPKIYNLCPSWKMWHGERSASVQHSIADS